MSTPVFNYFFSGGFYKGEFYCQFPHIVDDIVFHSSQSREDALTRQNQRLCNSLAAVVQFVIQLLQLVVHFISLFHALSIPQFALLVNPY